MVILEIKKEIVSGHRSSLRRIALPLSRMIVLGLTYLQVVRGHQEATRGWTIPVATNAAFTLPIILTLGRHVSPRGRAWLMALAIFDDVLGVVVIALFLRGYFVLASAGGGRDRPDGLIWANRAGVKTLRNYAIGCVLLWVALLDSGLHPTLAGVIT